MNTFVVDHESITIPTWVVDHESFRRWVNSGDFPEEGRICYLQGETWVDMSKEQAFSHNQVKTEIGFVVTGLAKQRGGTYFADGMYLSCEDVGLSSQPDGIYATEDAFDTGRLHFVEGDDEGYVELEGAPDMVLEVVSASSVKKDKVTLPELYWKAGITEYWLVDARGGRLEFDIFHPGSKGFLAIRRQSGWVRSNVFGASFRLLRKPDKRGNPRYSLLVR
jgi:Uma2 family endonuclease